MSEVQSREGNTATLMFNNRLLAKWGDRYFMLTYISVSEEFPNIYAICGNRIGIDEFVSRFHRYPVIYADDALSLENIDDPNTYRIVKIENAKIKRLSEHETKKIIDILSKKHHNIIADMKIYLRIM